MTNQKFLSGAAILTIAANTMNGPGITTLPDVTTNAGIFLYVALIIVSVAMAAFVSSRMVYAQWASLDDHPDNEKTRSYGSIDESEALLPHSSGDEGLSPINHIKQPVLSQTSIVGQSKEAYGRQASVYVAISMLASALCLALAQQMVCAAILDSMLIILAGKTCGLGLPTGESSSWLHCSTDASMKPFSTTDAPTSILSLGTVLAASASVAMGSVDLDEIIHVQYALFSFLVASVFRFSYVMYGMSQNIETAEPGLEETLEGDLTSSEVNWFVGPFPFQSVGPIMFSFAFIVTAPPLTAMAKSEKIAYQSLGWSCAVMGSLYMMIGLTGAPVSAAIRSGLMKGSDTNLLSLILLSGDESGPSIIDLIFIGLFGFSQVASVPVYCLLAKETLINDAGLAPTPSFLLSNVLPWILIALTYNASFFEMFVNWSGLVILGYANFSLPLWLDLKLRKVRAFAGRLKSNDISILKDGNDKAEVDADQTTKIVSTAVTASITAVIVMSITSDLPASGIVFLIICVVMQCNLQVWFLTHSFEELKEASLRSLRGLGDSLRNQLSRKN